MSEVTISRDEYDRLQRAERKLSALEAGGVDNWDGYDWAMEALEAEEEPHKCNSLAEALQCPRCA